MLKTLDSVCNQTIPPEKYEILVINDGSTDDTEETISNLKSQILKPEIRYFKIENGGPAKARNKGIKEAKGEIIFFTDDDCTVPGNWMETLLSGLKRYPEAAGAGGWYLPHENKTEKNVGFWQLLIVQKWSMSCRSSCVLSMAKEGIKRIPFWVTVPFFVV